MSVEWIYLCQGKVQQADPCEQSNKFLGSIKDGFF